MCKMSTDLLKLPVYTPNVGTVDDKIQGSCRNIFYALGFNERLKKKNTWRSADDP